METKMKFTCKSLIIKQIYGLFLVFLFVYANASENESKKISSVNDHSYYVSNDGSDETGDGSFGNPWKTIKYALNDTKNTNIVNAGDTLFIRKGIYREDSLYCRNSGTITNRIVVRSQHGEMATIKGDSTAILFFMGTYEPETVQYITFDSLHLLDARIAGFWIRSNGRMVKDITIENCIIENTVSYDNTGAVYSDGVENDTIRNCVIIGDGAKDENNAGIITFLGKNHFIYNNDISNVANGVYMKFTTSGGGLSKIENCYVHDVSYYGMHINSNNVLVKNNVIRNCIQTWASGGPRGGSNCVYEHNTIHADRSAGLMLAWDGKPNSETGDLGVRNTVVVNNVFYNTKEEYGSYSIWAYAPDSAFKVAPNDSSDYNCYYNVERSGKKDVICRQRTYYTLEEWKKLFSTYDNHSTSDMPIFKNSSRTLDSIEDFELESTSPGFNGASDGTDMGANVFLISKRVPDVLRRDSIKGIPDTVIGYKNDATFRYSITATRRPILYHAYKLPVGLTIDTVKGIIQGTPIDTGFTNATITAANQNGTSPDFTLVIRILESKIPIINSRQNVYAFLNRPFTYKISALSNPESFSARNLPKGLVLDKKTGIISGAVSEFSTAVCTLNASNPEGASKDYYLNFFMIDVMNTGKKTAIQAGKSFADTFAINDSLFVKYIKTTLLAGTGRSIPSIQNNGVSVVRSGLNWGLRVSIDSNIINDTTGFRGWLIVNDTLKTDTIFFSRPILRINSNFDNMYTPPMAWTPLSVTAYPDTYAAAKVLKSLFSDSGTYDIRKCRLKQWSVARVNSGSFTEYDSIPDSLFDFKPGRLFWIKTRDSFYINYGNATTVSMTDTFPIYLPPNTWTDFSLPFYYPVKISDIFSATRTKSGNTNLNLDSMEVYRWKKTESSYMTEPLFLSRIAGINSGSTAITGGNMNGYSIYNPLSTAVTLYIPPVCSLQTSVSGVGKNSAVILKQKYQGWSVRILCLDSAGNQLSQVYCGGDERLAKSVYYHSSPSMNSMSLLISDSVNGPFYGSMATNTQLGDGAIFPVAFSNMTEENKSVFMSIDKKINLPEGIEARLIDVSDNNGYLKKNEINVTVNKNSDHRFFLGIGTPEYLNGLIKKLAILPGIERIFPNPFRNRLCISYVVPLIPADRLIFSLTDLQGRCIWKKEVSDPKTGSHVLILDRKGDFKSRLASGVYLLRYDLKSSNKIIYRCNRRISCM